MPIKRLTDHGQKIFFFNLVMTCPSRTITMPYASHSCHTLYRPCRLLRIAPWPPLLPPWPECTLPNAIPTVAYARSICAMSTVNSLVTSRRRSIDDLLSSGLRRRPIDTCLILCYDPIGGRGLPILTILYLEPWPYQINQSFSQPEQGMDYQNLPCLTDRDA